MSALYSLPRRVALRAFALVALAAITACDVVPVPGQMGGSGPKIDPDEPVRVALLVPGGSGNQGDNLLARNLENAARLAVADLQGPQIDLKVYNTAGNANQATLAAQQAANEGAKIILGPLHREAAVAASTAVAPQGLSVLSFSNTSNIAGGNLFLLGQLYETTAGRLIGYGARQGITRYYVVTAEGPAGELGRAAITRAASQNGAQVVGALAYPLSQQDIMQATTTIAAQARAAGAQAVITTAQPGAELAILATLLPENNLKTPMFGLTRWDVAPELQKLPGLEGGFFAMPDTGRQNNFEARYAAAYGDKPHPLSGLAYDGVAAIGALLATGDRNALSPTSLTRRSGFQGVSGIFRLMPNGLNERGLAIATVKNGQVSVVEGAPTSFGGIN